ncbi:unnamed protein product, partial [Ixodes pacificus]
MDGIDDCHTCKSALLGGNGSRFGALTSHKEYVQGASNLLYPTNGVMEILQKCEEYFKSLAASDSLLSLNHQSNQSPHSCFPSSLAIFQPVTSTGEGRQAAHRPVLPAKAQDLSAPQAQGSMCRDFEQNLCWRGISLRKVGKR